MITAVPPSARAASTPARTSRSAMCCSCSSMVSSIEPPAGRRSLEAAEHVAPRVGLHQQLALAAADRLVVGGLEPVAGRRCRGRRSRSGAPPARGSDRSACSPCGSRCRRGRARRRAWPAAASRAGARTQRPSAAAEAIAQLLAHLLGAVVERRRRAAAAVFAGRRSRSGRRRSCRRRRYRRAAGRCDRRSRRAWPGAVTVLICCRVGARRPARRTA